MADKTSYREWPADRVERWPIRNIKPYPRNARLHSEEQIDLIASSMRKYGVTSPLLVDEDGVLIFGHGRLRAAIKLGYTELPVSIARGWSEEDKSAYRIADNQIALRSEWDMPLLKEEIAELSLASYEMPVLGFEDRMLGWLTSESVELDAVAEWVGMPEFVQNAKEAYRSLMVHFDSAEALAEFLKDTKRELSDKARYMWFPPREKGSDISKTYVGKNNEPAVPGVHRKQRKGKKSADQQGAGEDGSAVPDHSRRTRAQRVRGGDRSEKDPDPR